MINIKLKLFIIFISFIVSFLLVLYSYKIIVPENKIIVLEQETKELKKKILFPDEKKKPEIYEIVNLEDINKPIDLNIQKNKGSTKIIESENIEKGKLISNVANTYRVQIASLKDPEKIKVLYYDIKSKFPRYFKNHSPFIEKKILPNKGTFYRVQSFEKYSKKEAINICSLFILENLNCMIVKGIHE